MVVISPSHSFWDAALDARLRSMVDDGKSYSVIAAELGRTRNACIGRAHRIGVINTKPRPVKQSAEAVRKRSRPIERAILPPKQDNAPQPLYAQPEASTTAFGTPRRLLDLEPHHCRFSWGERDGQHLFCCADRLPGKSYCVEHQALIYRPSDRRDLSRLARAYRL